MPPPEAIRRRAEVVGTANATRPEAGYSLGLLLLRGILDQRQHDAGLAFAAAWRRWAGLAGMPAHTLLKRDPGPARPDVEAEEWQAARDRFRGPAAVLARVQPARLAWAAVESVAMDGWPGDAEALALFLSRPVAVEALRAGLSALADFYRMPAASAAA